MPFEVTLPFPLSLLEDFSSPDPEREVEKWRDEGARTRFGVTGLCVWAVAGWAACVVEVVVAVGAMTVATMCCAKVENTLVSGGDHIESREANVPR